MIREVWKQNILAVKFIWYDPAEEEGEEEEKDEDDIEEVKGGGRR